ncbi:hypothetical protein LWI28_021866 [Acer negundo]|uniref:Uncharacterized protein n=1 Tax=Acer negundo TaxID=4023 RepID=A0AAD5NIM6_ACENE|nr:hypothetical protein LWI28_021866 [Acer negundo]
MSILWEKSESWRWIVRNTRDSKPFFFAFATVCGVVPGIIGYCVVQVTNSTNPPPETMVVPSGLRCLQLRETEISPPRTGGGETSPATPFPFARVENGDP